jgi:hypothetical protein
MFRIDHFFYSLIVVLGILISGPQAIADECGVRVKKGGVKIGFFKDRSELYIQGATKEQVEEGLRRMSISSGMPYGLPGGLHELRLSPTSSLGLATPLNVPTLILKQSPTATGSEMYGMGTV